jgi:hypothetical protein
MGQAVARALRTIGRHKASPDQIDSVIIAAINVTLCVASGGDDRVAEGFNNDIAVDRRPQWAGSAHRLRAECPTDEGRRR